MLWFIQFYDFQGHINYGAQLRLWYNCVVLSTGRHTVHCIVSPFCTEKVTSWDVTSLTNVENRKLLWCSAENVAACLRLLCGHRISWPCMCHEVRGQPEVRWHRLRQEHPQWASGCWETKLPTLWDQGGITNPAGALEAPQEELVWVCVGKLKTVDSYVQATKGHTCSRRPGSLDKVPLPSWLYSIQALRLPMGHPEHGGGCFALTLLVFMSPTTGLS